MSKKQFIIPALALGLLALGGGSAYAFGPNREAFNMAAFSSFSANQQAAIQKAEDIRTQAEKQAEDVLTAAGITQEQMHTAMHEYRQKQHAAIDTALDNKDYASFEGLVSGTPMADGLTEDIFNKLVQIRADEKSGDFASAQTLRKELRDAGYKGFMEPIMGHGMRGMHAMQMKTTTPTP